MAERIGRQFPTQSFVLPYKDTAGPEAVEIYEKSGREPYDWQKLLDYDIFARNTNGEWTHMKYGFAVPRQNGKNEVIAIREIWGLMHGERILHTAHCTSTEHAAWKRLLTIMTDAKLVDPGSKDKGIYRASGKEHIYLDAYMDGGGRIEFRTRTSKGGLGESYDLLVIDEAQEYQDDQKAALQYTIAASENPQTILCGTPPTVNSVGTIFPKMRASVLAGESEDTGWSEWSVDEMTDPYDKDAWYKTNPSLGLRLKERTIRNEIGGDDVDFNVQRLGLWLSYSQNSAISKAEWKACQAEAVPKLRGKLFIGIKYGSNNQNVAMSIAIKTTTGKMLDEKTFKLKKMMPGDNAPPIHPNCRCSVCAALSDAEFIELTGVDPAKLDENGNVINEKHKDAFTPAKSVKEAEQVAGQYFENDFMDRTFKGKASYTGISLDHANQINQTLEDLVRKYPDAKKITGIKSIDPTSTKGKKIFTSEDAVMAYDLIQHGIYINRKVLKNANSLKEYNKQSKEAWDTVMGNLDMLSDSQKQVALRYKEAGRSLVGDGSVKDYLIHEYEHHAAWDWIDTKTNNALGERMSKYAPHISGYATASKNEYLAESFVAYNKGRLDGLDPQYKNAIDSLNKRAKAYVLSENNNEVKSSITFTTDNGRSIIMTSKQYGKKAGKHAAEFGINISSEKVRDELKAVIQDIIDTNDVRICQEWRGQNGPVTCYVKHGDAVIVNQDGYFVTVMKGGAENARVKNARKR